MHNWSNWPDSNWHLMALQDSALTILLQSQLATSTGLEPAFPDRQSGAFPDGNEAIKFGEPLTLLLE